MVQTTDLELEAVITCVDPAERTATTPLMGKIWPTLDSESNDRSFSVIAGLRVLLEEECGHDFLPLALGGL
ncbi:hypothetical protein GJ744_010465 [Endocarpon pusillum]|uniref:Uncharacterized protein n=1 Tax=Endocarpon pusillum TaxID=364733 RepID=A0A8H7AHV5_9EURO|nr:hypothetical protein GJ744_010465 [Endocarpon pusillum]